MSLYKYRRHLKLRVQCLEITFNGLSPLGFLFLSGESSRVFLFSSADASLFFRSTCKYQLAETKHRLPQEAEMRENTRNFSSEWRKNFPFDPRINALLYKPWLLMFNPPTPDRAYWKGREQTNRHHLFIMTTLKPRMELDITPVSTS